MRISPKVAIGAVLVATAAAISGCGGTVDGVATCPGCGGGIEPEFPTPRPIPSTPTTTAVPSTTASSRPPGPTATKPPAGGEVLPANEAGYVYIETKTGKTRCQISADNVGCESEFGDAPVLDGQKATGVEVSASGSNRWVVGNLGAMPTTTIDYATYSAVGWSIVADSTGTTFTSDSTGHGMFVSTDRVDFF
jgi:hypothetical protein